MIGKILLEATAKFLLGMVLVGLMIFLPAGTVRYVNGWIFMVILFVPMFVAGIVLMIKNPLLLKNRLDGRERRKNQALAIKLSGLMFSAGFIVAGLGVRLHWYQLPETVVWLSVVVFLAAYLLYAEVLRENAYLSRAIKKQEGQQLIDTGLYGVVRHPMYSATVILFLSMPLILGSLYSFLIFLSYPFIIAERIRDEETFLERELEGYREYKTRVRYRLIPLIW